MKNTRQLAVIAALGMLAFATSDAKAILLTVEIKGSAVTQEASTNGTKITYKEKKNSVGTQDLLKTVGAASNPAVVPTDGSTFVYNTEAVGTNVFTIRDKNGNILTDCSNVIHFERDTAGATKKGSVDTATGAINTTTSFYGSIEFAPGNGNVFVVSGLATDKLSVSKLDNNNARKVSETITLKSGVGPGEVGGAFATTEGSVTLKGSETVTQAQ
jgi:hypothetical protein